MNENKEEKEEFRSGLAALVGLANVGKSTLMNALVGEKVAIVSPRPQTTRNSIYGIKTTEDYQVVFVDTPGFHTPKTRLNKVIVQEAIDSISIVDVVCLLCEAEERISSDFKRLLEMVNAARQPKILVITKIDGVPRETVYKTAETVFAMGKFTQILPVSALKNINVDKLLDAVVAELPKNVMQYDEDLVTTQPEKFLAAEYIREQIFLNLRKEVPYDTLVNIESFKEEENMLDITAIIYVNRDSQKGIMIGEGGSMLKKIGSAARKNLAAFFGKKVHLEIWVKVKEGWVGKREYLNMQGLD